MTVRNDIQNDSKTNITVIFTCHNRKEKTENCIHTLITGNPACQFAFVIVDDNSTDGTRDMLEELRKKYSIHILRGDGSLFYSRGMRLGMQYVWEQHKLASDYILLVNDDVTFFDHTIERMVQQSRKQGDSIVAGAMCDDHGQLSYSAVKYLKGIQCRNLETCEWNIPADTFCANGVLIPYQAFKSTAVIDKKYVHAMGDFDYGISLRRNGFMIYASRDFVGMCNDNPKENTWADTSLSIWERIRKKETPKGLPAKQWFYYLYKNFGFFWAIWGSCTPYIRIVLGR